MKTPILMIWVVHFFWVQKPLTSFFLAYSITFLQLLWNEILNGVNTKRPLSPYTANCTLFYWKRRFCKQNQLGIKQNSSLIVRFNERNWYQTKNASSMLRRGRFLPSYFSSIVARFLWFQQRAYFSLTRYKNVTEKRRIRDRSLD